MPKRRKGISLPVLLILPMEAILWGVLIFPFVLMIYLSFFNWTPMMGNWWEAPFYGVTNYVKILMDKRFMWAAIRSVFYVATAGTLEFLIGLGIAVTLASIMSQSKKFFVTFFITPMMFIPAVVGYAFYILFFEGGAVTEIMRLIIANPPLIVSNPQLAHIPVILADVWQWTPFMFLILYSGIIALPQEPLKAARVLGASELQIFRDITLPMLKPIIIIAVLIRFLELYKLFDAPYLITHGGPGTATETISIYMLYSGFQYFKLAYIAAGAVFILVIILLILILGRVTKALGY